MEDMQVLKNTEVGELAVLIINGKEMFPATDCARMPGYSNPYKAIGDHCRPDGVMKREGVSVTTNQYGASTEKKRVAEDDVETLQMPA